MKANQEFNQTSATVSAMFMWSGISEANYKDGKSMRHVLEVWDRGCFELCTGLSRWGTISEEMLVARKPQDFPGVYDYEVSEPFGAWFGQYILDNGDRPVDSVAKAELQRLADAFFNQGAPTSKPMTRAERFYSSAGFSLVETGGGCTAFQKNIRDGHILITVQNDASAPESELDPVIVGVYPDEASEASASLHALNGEEAIRWAATAERERA